jgi:hypothetical protein
MHRTRTLVPALCAAVLLLASLAGPASADTALRDRARQLVALDHHAFLLVKATAEPPFDWSTDGCTSTPASWALTFAGPCEQHDFGYRNLGHGLRLWATRAARAWVDGRFLTELRRVCAERFAGRATTRCRARARAMHVAVRFFNPPWS